MEQPLDDAAVEVSATESESAGKDGGIADAAAVPVELRTRNAAISSLLGKVAGVHLGEQSIPASTLEGYAKRMSSEELRDALDAHTRVRKASSNSKRCPRNKSATLPLRVATGEAYKEFLKGDRAD